MKFSLENKIIDINTVQINNGSFFFKEFKGNTTNLDFIINYFDSGKPTVKKKNSKPFDVNIGRIILNKISFKYKNYAAKDTIQGKSVNFDNVHLKNLSGIFEGLDTKNHLVKTHIKNLTFSERSGFYLKNLTAITTIDSNAIELKDLLLVTNQSRLTNYYKMTFKTFKDVNKYIDNVRMKAVFKESHLTSRDVAFFAQELENMKLDLDIDGQITGLVTN